MTSLSNNIEPDNSSIHSRSTIHLPLSLLWGKLNENNALTLLKQTLDSLPTAEDLALEEARKLLEEVKIVHSEHTNHFHLREEITKEILDIGERIKLCEVGDTHYHIRDAWIESGFNSDPLEKVSYQGYMKYIESLKRISDEVQNFISSQCQIAATFEKLEECRKRLTNEDIRFNLYKSSLSPLVAEAYKKYEKSLDIDGHLPEEKVEYIEDRFVDMIRMNMGSYMPYTFDVMEERHNMLFFETTQKSDIYPLLKEHHQTFEKANADASSVYDHPYQTLVLHVAECSPFYSHCKGCVETCDERDMYTHDGRKIDHYSGECQLYNVRSFRSQMSFISYLKYILYEWDYRGFDGDRLYMYDYNIADCL